MIYSIKLKGKSSFWAAHIDMTPEHAKDWENDGFDIEPLSNIIPRWVPHWLVKPFARAQDLFNFWGKL